MLLSKLIGSLKDYKTENYKDVDITGISYNSKDTKSGDIFICIRGETADGHIYAQNAADNGASALFCEEKLNINIPQIIVKDTKRTMAYIASAFYNEPSQKLNLIGVTGTNGKTTVTHLIQRILEENKEKCALIGTLGYKLSSTDEYKEAKHTTPQPPELQRDLKLMLDDGINNVVMEVSSHSLEQNRVGCCCFNGAVFTNLTQDHLDYHITMKNYFKAKAILFENLKEGSFAVINADDNYAKDFISVIPSGVKVITYGVKNQADVKAENIDFSIDGAKFTIEFNNQLEKMNLHLNGMFSVYNALAAFSTGLALGIDYKTIINALENTGSVAGRFEIVSKKPLVIVDYAHTPDGLENVLKAARELTPVQSNLICLFGCGGDRDTTKRPKMGKIADELSDKVVVTSDNPRSEDPQLIISDIMAGIKTVDTQRIFVEPDRRNAIKFLKTISTPLDVIVIAGKGHENYQILKNETIHFDDREEAGKVFADVQHV
ncbi:MAG: UDP-N-acetylmuramoyl-L-alanyl-D-glutamate--2,6-diaminopimelate ligase [Candidatus Gastranaerophilales bacterium]|nr:UDP-N-acetylmuramoyl-L-alanyl-D-glutamate--2,6-diaminopimelate ligase [Candidatus Gastranaerophilales bacterium]